MMNSTDLDLDAVDYLVHQTVVGNRGMSKKVAPDMGISQQSFLNKSNHNRHDTHFSPTEMLQLMHGMNDYRVLEEVARQCGFRLVANVVDKNISLLDAIMAADSEHGDFAKHFVKANSDGVIKKAEELKGLSEIDEEIRALECKKVAFKAFAKSTRGGSHG